MILQGCIFRLGVGLAILTAGFGPAFAQEAAPAASDRNPAQVMLFHRHPEEFKGGRQVAVTVYISAVKWDGITAMGLYETVPEGWTFAGARAVAGAMPGVAPARGDSGVLEFMWIEQSNAPITFQYVLNVPPGDGGARFISGQVEYRQGDGALSSNVAMTQLVGTPDAPPTLMLRGSAEMTVSENAPFNDPGAEASDPEDGNLSNRVEVAGAVDTSTPGNYTLTYSVSDSVGNRADPVSRFIRVTDTASEPGGEKPDQPDGDSGGVAIPDGAGGMERPRLARADGDVSGLNAPKISVPEVRLNAPGGRFEVPMRDAAGDAEDSEAGGKSGPGERLANARAGDPAHLDGRADPDSEGEALALAGGAPGGGPGDGDITPELARPAWMLVLVAVLLAAAVIVFSRPRWRVVRRPPGRG